MIKLSLRKNLKSKDCRITRRMSVRTHLCNNVLPDYVNAYASYICDPTNVRACLDSHILPPLWEQYKIIHDLSLLQSEMDLYGLDGVFMKLFIIHDDETIEQLKTALSFYDSAKHAINEIVKASQEISTGISNVEI